jgi:anti-sigma factor RsiW
MEHEQAQKLLSCYVDKTLDPKSTQKLETHLEGCRECRGDLDLLKKTLQAIGEIPPAEVPSDFSARLRRKARKAGLFQRHRRRSATRQMVPIEASMAVLLAAIGGLVVLLLTVYSQIQFEAPQNPPAVLLVESKDQVNQVARSAWEAGGEVRIPGRPAVPAQAPLGAPPELELHIPEEAWPAFDRALEKSGLKAPGRPQPDADGRLRVVVQIRLRADAPVPGEEDPASSADRPRNRPDPESPPPGGKE